MKRFPELALLMLLAGCVATPAQLMKMRAPNSYESTQAPRAVVNCMARNHIHTGGNAPAITELPDGGMEFVITDRQYALIHFYAVVLPSEKGSGIRTWTTSPYLRDTIEKGLLTGC